MWLAGVGEVGVGVEWGWGWVEGWGWGSVTEEKRWANDGKSKHPGSQKLDVCESLTVEIKI